MIDLINSIINRFKPKSYDIARDDNNVIDVWYDKSERLWVAQLKDKQGNQIGISGFGHTKHQALIDLHYQQHE